VISSIVVTLLSSYKEETCIRGKKGRAISRTNRLGARGSRAKSRDVYNILKKKKKSGASGRVRVEMGVGGHSGLWVHGNQEKKLMKTRSRGGPWRSPLMEERKGDENSRC